MADLNEQAQDLRSMLFEVEEKLAQLYWDTHRKLPKTTYLKTSDQYDDLEALGGLASALSGVRKSRVPLGRAIFSETLNEEAGQ